MASWKEKGEVPDSDEEDDDDSQDIANEGYGRSLLQAPRDAQRERNGSRIGDGDTRNEKYDGQLAADASKVVAPAQHHPQSISKQPSLSPRIFRKPLSLLDQNQLPEKQQMSSKAPPHIDDEISHSYVRLSSSLSSLNTPPAEIQQLDNAASTDEQEAHSPRLADDLLTQQESRDWQKRKDIGNFDERDDFPSTIRRSLRQRNPIQLHPYALEGEKYRRTLMARGMRPLRLAQAQEDIIEVVRDHSSPDSDSEAENESQLLSVTDEPQQPQSSQPFISGGFSAVASPSYPSTQSGGEDDEFPDIDQLLDRSHERFVQAGPKRRKTRYGSTHMSRLPSGSSLLRVAPNGSSSSKETQMLSIPPSPPATSSPIPIFHAPFSEQHSRHVTSNLASSRAVSLEYAGSELGATTGNLPTPATNLAKHTIDLTTEDQIDEDPFASDTDSSVVSYSSEIDQSMQVRRVGKKIRGVLPASWLRLDQQTRQDSNSKVTHREHRSLSPIKAALSRRGVAVPKDTTNDGGPKAAWSNADSHFMLSESDEDEASSLQGLVQESASDLFQKAVFSQTDVGSVMEDDRVDAMLPSQKRQAKLLPGTTHRRRRPVSTSLFVQRHSGPSFQPKITQHLQKTRSPNFIGQKNTRHRTPTRGPVNRIKTLRSQRYPQSSIPKLSILDVIKPCHSERLPAFIRIAARNARSSKGLGRHSPTKKFIKLANRTDTQDALAVLQDWREGTLHPCTELPDCEQFVGGRQPLSDISDNIQTTATSALGAESDPEIETTHLSAFPRKIVVSRSSTQAKVARLAELRPMVSRGNGSTIRTKAPKNRIRAPNITTSSARPAQLETSATEYSTRHPSGAFGSTKKALDTLYRKAHKGNKVRGDVQLARFFGEKSSLYADTSVIIDKTLEDRTSLTKKADPIKPARRRKRLPQHVDANAAVFRQPSEPLILDFLQLAPETQEKYGQDGKLLGLGKYGTTYTHHFDIWPLQPGVFFHESTFIGSGRLSRALEIPSNRCFDSDCGYYEFQLAGKQLRWGPWDDTVSSEFGMCFDWISEQLEDSTTKLSDIDVDVLTGCITHIVDYAQSCLSFSDSVSRSECVLRAIEVLHCFTKQLEVLTRRSSLAADKLPVFIELSCRVMVLCFQFLRIAQSGSGEIDMAPRLESLLQKVAALTVSLLLSLGLAPIRRLYDDLQYLAYRKAGINRDRYAVQAWVIAMHTVHAAQIPRVTFWDVVNSQLIKDDEAQVNDARVLERMWYDMFSLLPLADFDMNGALIPGIRLLRSSENWALPQRMAKKIFELYNSKSRQSPSFNDYCRALFSRCNHLMQDWGWRRHGIIVGTLFDFFATRKLAHLRNEEVYRSPRFLEELDKEPSLVVDSEDRCFHILLKIIAISIKQMREAGDTKGIRNLVTRVLPNHDRQYPREKTVHQRDLASLRNHHDLLCTLFWAAPPDLRPPITLIRELVNPESSHQEAYLINLRSWENLTRFVLAFSPTPTAYLPLAKWQNESFTQLLVQHQSAEADCQDQFRNLPAASKQLISQHAIAKTITENKNHIVMALARNLRSCADIIDGVNNMNVVKVVVNNTEFINSVSSGLGMAKHRHEEEMPVVEAALDIVHGYVRRLLGSGLISDVCHHVTDDDSQEYGRDIFADVPVEIFDYIGHLNGELMAGVRDVLRTCLHSGLSIRASFKEKVVETWALTVATLILAKCYDLSDFLPDSAPFNELSLDDQNPNSRHYATRLLDILVTVLGDHLLLDTTGRDLLSDWLCILINPITCFASEHKLLPVFAKYESVIAQASSTFQGRKIGNRADVSTLEGIKSGRVDLIHDTLEAMARALRNESSHRNRYRKIVQRMLIQMKADLGAMDPRSSEIEQHQKFVNSIHIDLTTFFRDLSASDLSDEFFTTNSTYPADDKSHQDSEMICATLRNYGLRLGTTRGKNELNHYLLAILKYAAVEGKLPELSQMVRDAMGNEQGTWAELSHHVLTVLTPSFIHAAFVSEQGWLLAEPLFEAAQEHLMDIADCDRRGAVLGVSKIMSSIVLGVVVMMAAHSSDEIRIDTSRELVYVLLMSTRFMALAFDWLPLSMELCSEKNKEISSRQEFFYQFACGAKAYFSSPIKWFVNSLRRHVPSTGDFDDRELLVTEYQEAMRGVNNDNERIQALHRLAEPFARDEEELIRIKDELRVLQRHNSMSALWLFNHMRCSSFFNRAAHISETSPDMNVPQFSGIILEDYRDNWTGTSDSGELEIMFGQKKLRAKGLMADGKSMKSVFDELRKSLDYYIACYEKVHRSASQVVRDDRQQRSSATRGLIL